MMSTLIGRLVGGVVRTAPLTLLIATLLVVVAGRYAQQHLGVDTDTASMFSSELQFRKTLDEYKKQFPERVNTLVVVLDATTPDLARQAAEALTERMQWADAVFKNVYMPTGGSFLASHALLYLSVDQLQKLSDHLARAQPFMGRLTEDPTLRGLFSMLQDAIDAPTDEDADDFDLTPVLERINRAIEATTQGSFDPLSWQELFNGDDVKASLSHRSIIIAQPRVEFDSMLPGAPAMHRIRQMAADLNLDKAHGVTVRITGQIAMATEELKSVSKSAGWGAVLAMGLVFALLIVALRSIWHVLASMLTLVAGLIITAGYAAFAVGDLNMISVAMGALYIGLGIDYAIHLCLRYQELARRGAQKHDAIQRAAADVGPSLALCTASTAIGFFAFLPTSFNGVSELGLIAGTGMLISLVVTLCILPALLAISPAPRFGNVASVTEHPITAMFDRLQLRRKTVRIGAAILGAGGLLLITQVQFDDNPLDLRDPNTESISTFKDLLADTATPSWSVSVLATNEASAQSIKRQMKDLDVVDKVVTINSFIPGDQEAKLAIIDDIGMTLGPMLPIKTDAPMLTQEERLSVITNLSDDIVKRQPATIESENDAALATLHNRLSDLLITLQGDSTTNQAQRLDLLDRNVLSALPANLLWLGESLNATTITMETLPDDLRRRWVSDAGVGRVEVFPKADLSDTAELRRFVSAVQNVAPNATGAPIVFVESGEAVVHAFQEAMAMAMLAITLLLLSLLRSIRDTLLVLVPLVLAGVLTTAAAVLTNTPFNFANVIALPLLLGVGVDSGIHIVHGARMTTDPGKSLLRSSTARAVLYSAMTTMCGFGALAFWAHRGTASLGRLLTLGIVFTLLCTLIVLPALLQGKTATSDEGEPAPTG